MANTANLYASKLEVGQAQKEATINAFFDLLDSADSGRLPLSLTGGTRTLTGTVAAPEAQNKFFDCSGTLTSNQIVEVPVSATSGRSRVTVWKNGTSGAFTLTVRQVGGTGVTVTQGSTAILLYNDTDIVKLYEVNHTTGVIASSSLGGAWASWVPTWTNVTVGNGTVVAAYLQIGKIVFCRLSLVFGSTTAVSGDISFSLPVARATYGGSDSITPMGRAQAYDQSVASVALGTVQTWTSSTTAAIRFENSAGTYLVQAVASSTVPFTWAVSDELAGTFTYQAA